MNARGADTEFERFMASSMRQWKHDTDAQMGDLKSRLDTLECKVEKQNEMTSEVVDILKNAKGFFRTVDGVANVTKRMSVVILSICGLYLIIKEFLWEKIKSGL